VLNQAFTADNFRKIFDYENRKGVYLEGMFFPEIEEITRELKDHTFNFRNLKRQKSILPEKDYEEQKITLNNKKDILKEKKEQMLSKRLEEISQKITSGDFQVTLLKGNVIGGKPVYCVDKNCPITYFIIKQIQYNIRKLYKVKQSNRYNIVCQLRETLSNTYPKYIIKTDINNFYESISSEKLIRSISKDPLLTFSSKKIIKHILTEYKHLSGSTNGVPRGIGISAYLSEIYMREFDSKIQSDSNIAFYARYVDDIVIICTPRLNSNISSLVEQLEYLVNTYDLTLNPEKTTAIDLSTPANKNFDYLGYNFSFGTKKTTLTVSSKKIEKYKTRIQLSFEKYFQGSVKNEKKARKLLLRRIRFLTTNTRLLNSKRNAVVGIYFSNSLITDESCLEILDKQLEKGIETVGYETLKKQLRQFSFITGFTQQRFSKFKTQELSEIVRAWKNVR
jgi:hypothetical protein